MKKLLSLLAVIGLTAPIPTSIVACGGNNSLNDDEGDEENHLNVLRDELHTRLLEATEQHLTTFITQNAIIAPNETNVQLLNLGGMQSLTSENSHLTGQLTSQEMQTLNDDIAWVINFNTLQTLLQAIANEAQFNVITQGMTGNVLESVNLHIANGFGSSADVWNQGGFLTWFTTENDLIGGNAFVGNFSVNFSLEVRFTSIDSFTVSRNLTTVTTNNIQLGNALIRYTNEGGQILGKNPNAVQLLTSSSRTVIENRSNDETYLVQQVTNSLSGATTSLESVFLPEFFNPLIIEGAGVNLGLQKSDENSGIIAQNSLMWTDEFFKNNRVDANVTSTFTSPNGFTRAYLQSLDQHAFQATNLIWGVDMGSFDNSQNSTAIEIEARRQIIDDYINVFNDDLNTQFSNQIEIFTNTYSAFTPYSDAIVKYGHAILNNINLTINNQNQILLPAIQIPLAVTVNDQNRLSEEVSQAYAENIRRALAAIQHFYTIDVNQYQEGAQSLLGGFRSDSIAVASGEFNFFNDVITDVNTLMEDGPGWWISPSLNLQNRFNLVDPNWPGFQLRPVIQNQINQTNDFRHSFGWWRPLEQAGSSTYFSMQKQEFNGLKGFNLTRAGEQNLGGDRPQHLTANIRFEYFLELDYFGVWLLWDRGFGSPSQHMLENFSPNHQNFIFTRA